MLSGGWSGEVRLQAKGGELIPNHETATPVRDGAGHVVGFVCTTRDIQEEKEAEEALRSRTQELETLVGVASALAESGSLAEGGNRVLADEEQRELHLVASLGSDEMRHGHVQSIQQGLAGLAFREGKPVVDNDYPSHLQASRVGAPGGIRSALALPIRSGGHIMGVLTLNSRQPGHFTQERVWLLSAVADGMGALLENAKFHESEHTHTLELQETLEQLRATQEQPIQSDRLATLGELVAGVAHEVNNPLTGASGITQLLLRQELDEPVREDLVLVYAEVNRAARIVQNLLAFARQHPPEQSYISMNEILQRVVDLRSYELRVNNIELITDLSPDLPMTMGDTSQLQQVFLNIVINAEQAMAKASGQGRLQVTTRLDEGNIEIIFADDGPGISATYLSRIFDPFFTTKGQGQGTGLGLSICYGIIQEHHGEITASSKEGQGATFTVKIPLTSDGSGDDVAAS